jgi:hypothetical protein
MTIDALATDSLLVLISRHRNWNRGCFQLRPFQNAGAFPSTDPGKLPTSGLLARNDFRLGARDRAATRCLTTALAERKGREGKKAWKSLQLVGT